jgi:hypothetical protein
MQYRQGDVFIEEISDLPDGKELPREPKGAILAHGEATGHAHAVRHEGATMRQAAGGFYLNIVPTQDSRLLDTVIDNTTQAANLTHEEHLPIPLVAGKKYRVIRQLQEKDDAIMVAFD